MSKVAAVSETLSLETLYNTLSFLYETVTLKLCLAFSINVCLSNSQNSETLSLFPLETSSPSETLSKHLKHSQSSETPPSLPFSKYGPPTKRSVEEKETLKLQTSDWTGNIMLCNRRTNVLRYLPLDEWRWRVPDPLMRSRGWWTPLSFSLSVSLSHTHPPSPPPSLLASLTLHTYTLHTQPHLIMPYTPMYVLRPTLLPVNLVGRYLVQLLYDDSLR